MIIFATSVFGLIVGSFLNVVINRIHNGEEIVVTASHCPDCQTKLTWWELIPVVSFFILKGKCRTCEKPISWQYPLVEIATAFGFVAIGYTTNCDFSNPALYFQCIFVCFLIVLFVYDLKHYLILDRIVFPAALLALVYQVYQGNINSALIGAVLLSGFFASLYFISRGRWIGFGDVKLGLFLGLIAGFPEVVVTFFVAYISGALFVLPLLVFQKRGMADKVPFGTFLTFGAFITMIWGKDLADWYLRLIGIY